MRLIYAIDGHGNRLYLCLDGTRVAFTRTRAAAAIIQIESPYSAAPLTLATAAANPPVVFRFQSHPDTPMYPATGAVTEGTTLSVAEKPQSSAEGLYRRWTVTYNPDSHAYHICQSIAPTFGISVTSPLTPILTALQGLCSFRDEPVTPAETDTCESCGADIEAGDRVCSSDCRCDATGCY